MNALPGRPAPPFGSALTIFILAMVFGIAAFGTDMYLPAFPAIREYFGVAPDQVQLSLSLFLYGNACGHLFFGPLSDRFGRKPVLILGLVAYAGASLGCALAPTIHDFLVFRCVQGVASASAPVLIRALINDRLDRTAAAEMLALLTGIMAFAAMLTPTLGGWLVSQTDWPVIFYFLAVLAVVLTGASIARIGETLPRESRHATLSFLAILRTYARIANNVRFWCYALPPAVMFGGVFAYATVNSFLLIDELGVSETLQGMSYSIAALSYVAGSLTSNRIVRRLGIDRAIVYGITAGLTAAIGAVTLSLTAPLSVAIVLAPGLCLFFTTSLILPIAFSMAVSLYPSHAGSASAVVGCVQLGFAGIGSVIAANTYDGTTLPLHLLTMVCCVVAAGIWWFGRRFRRDE